MVRFATLTFLAFLLLPPLSPAFSVQPGEILKDQALEQRARNISRELRCLVCQNQSIDDSNAPLARDLRLLVRERLRKGDTDQEVIDFIVDRYGEFVLLQPRFAPHTLLLWLAPPALFLLGIFVLYRSYRRRSEAASAEGTKSLTAKERRALEKLLRET